MGWAMTSKMWMSRPQHNVSKPWPTFLRLITTSWFSIPWFWPRTLTSKDTCAPFPKRCPYIWFTVTVKPNLMAFVKNDVSFCSFSDYINMRRCVEPTRYWLEGYKEYSVTWVWVWYNKSAPQNFGCLLRMCNNVLAIVTTCFLSEKWGASDHWLY